MRKILFLTVFGLLVTLSLSAKQVEKAGLLVMAHGGSPEWNRAVLDAVMPLEKTYSTAVAFGMANPKTLQDAVFELEHEGVTRIAVVRLFMSAESFLLRTLYSLRLSNDESVFSEYSGPPRQLDIAVPVSINKEGLLDASFVGQVLTKRASGLSTEPEKETVLIIGHGPENDEENQRWLERMNLLAESVRESALFHTVRVFTLREDWTGKRKPIELELQTLLRSEAEAGREVLVIPFRLFGFGPYAEVLDGLSYRADSLGLLPDTRVSDWIREQLEAQF